MEQRLAPTVGNYEVVRPLGEGGMAQVYLCVRRGAGGFQKRVVMKVLHSKFVGDPEFIRMFLEEARLLAQLQHPNIVNAIEVECVDGVPFLAMEYVNGPTLTRLQKRAERTGKHHLGFMLHIVAQICQGLHYAHQLKIDGQPAGVIHRDVSSQNILVDAATGVAKLIDFGIAKSEADDPRTQVGVLKGKYHYMAPEVLMGKRADARADLYAVGVLLYKLVTDKLPFGEGEDVWEARVANRFPKPSELVRDVPEAVDAIVLKALRADPRERYASADELARDLLAESELHGASTAGVSAWIHQLFPGGEEEWSKRYSPQVLTATTHSALQQLVTDGGSPLTIAKTGQTVVPAAPSRGRGWMIGLAGALSGAALLLALWAASPGTSAPIEDPRQFLAAAEQLLGEGDFGAAREMNARAGAHVGADAETGALVARQKGQIERQAALAEARTRMTNGQIDEARQILGEALSHSPSDPELSALLGELEQAGAGAGTDAGPALALLGSAERAVARGDLTEAANQLRAVEGLALTEPELVARTEKLSASITLASRVKAARELIATDPALALERALVLEGEFPGDPGVSRLVTAVRTALSKKSAPPPRPRPSAEPAARGVLVVGGGPVGASVHVDGAFRGVLPLSIELPIGKHEVSVSADGHGTRKSSVELTQGATQKVDLTLKPAQAPAPTGLKSPFSSGQNADPGLQDPFGRNP